MPSQSFSARRLWWKQSVSTRRPRRLLLEDLERREVPAVGAELFFETVPASALSASITETEVAGNRLFFSANFGADGSRLYVTDGTAAGTQIVRQFAAGNDFPHELTNVNGTLFFAAEDGSAGEELWKSDGTSAGTVLVKDIQPGSGEFFFFGSSPSGLVNVNGTLFFSANDGSAGQELWRSDGTSAGTVLVRDINPASNSSFPFDLVNVNGTLFFSAHDDNIGRELWKSDGTSAGTQVVRDIFPGGRPSGEFGIIPNDSFPSQLTNVNGVLLFSAEDGSAGDELWRSDGTSAGTQLVRDINPGSNGSFLDVLTNLNGTLYFSAFDGSSGSELWKSNGTSVGTVLVRDINPGSGDGFPGGSEPGPNFTPLAEVNGTVFFYANDGSAGLELWKTDGTSSGTVLVRDINPGSDGSSFIDGVELFNAGGVLIFPADNGSSGTELWSSDGTSAGTRLAADINPGSGSSSPEGFTLFGRAAYFTASNPTSGRELWRTTSGQVSGTVFDDVDADGVLDESEEIFFGATVFADNNNNGALDAGDDSVTTGDDGGYTLTRLSAGTHVIRVVVPTDFEPTVPPTGSHTITLTQAEVRAGVDFGLRHVNRAPTDITLSSNTVQENAPGAVIGTLTATDPDVADTHTFAVNDARFEVVGNQLKLRAGVSLDFEATPTVTVQVTATDNRTPPLSFTKSFTIQVQDVNETPTNITLSNNTVAENAPGAVVGTLTVSDPDNGQTFTFTVTDSRFEVVNSQLKLRPGVALDFETTPSVALSVTATDSGSPPLSVTRSFTVLVQDVNEVPTDVTLSNNQVTENAPGAVIGTLTVSDPDRGQTFTFSVSDPRFEIVGSQLKLRDGVFLDFESSPLVALTVTVTDSGSPPLSLTRPFAIQVLDVNEAPTDITLSNGRVTENVRGAVVGTLSATDPDRGQTHTFTVDDPRFEVVGSQLKLRAGEFLDAETTPTVTVGVTTTDNGSPPLSFTERLTIQVVDVNDTTRLGAYRFATDGAWTLDSNGNGVYDPGVDAIYPHYGGPGGAQTRGEPTRFQLTVPVTTDVFNSQATRVEPVSVPIVGDWNDDGADEVGYFVDGVWHFDVNGNGFEDPGELTATFGGPGDQPVVGRFFGRNNPSPFGNGLIVGVFTTRIDGLARFVLDRNGNMQIDPGEETAPYGTPTDDVITGDWNGDGRTKFGVFRPDPQNPEVGVFSLDLNGNLVYDGPGESFTFGAGTDAFVVGDWGSNGFDSLGVMRPAPDGSGRGYFTLDVNGNHQYDPGVDRVSFFGNETDYFIAGKWRVPDSALRALGGPGFDPLAPRLDPRQLAALVKEGTATWAARGYDVAPLTALRFQVASLGTDLLGLASPGVVTLDDDAAGHGWSLAPQPGRIDALSAVMHELGHELGLADRLDADPFTDVMAGYLPTGVRRR